MKRDRERGAWKRILSGRNSNYFPIIYYKSFLMTHVWNLKYEDNKLFKSLSPPLSMHMPLSLSPPLSMHMPLSLSLSLSQTHCLLFFTKLKHTSLPGSETRWWNKKLPNFYQYYPKSSQIIFTWKLFDLK